MWTNTFALLTCYELYKEEHKVRIIIFLAGTTVIALEPMSF